MIVKQNEKFLDLAKNTLQIESTGIDQLRLRLDQEIHGQAFLSAIELILPLSLQQVRPHFLCIQRKQVMAT
jgi:hypothetical protein